MFYIHEQQWTSLMNCGMAVINSRDVCTFARESTYGYYYKSPKCYMPHSITAT